MTPFSPAALVVMLLTFYPDVSGATLARARLERPDYFAGGTLGGSHGDKLTLPDGACWDCIYASGTNDPTLMRWQCIPCGDGAPGDPRYPLEPGPLAPIDLTLWPEPTPMPVFVPLVADGLAPLSGVDDVLHLAGQTVTEQSSPDRLEASFAGTIGPADGTLSDELDAVAGATPDEIYGTTVGQGPVIDRNAAVFDETLPDDLPPGPDLPPAPPPDVPQLPDHQ